jgi:hypothetical protein
MAALKCAKCEKMYGAGDGEGGHCTQCCESFSSQASFDAHIQRKVEGRPHTDVTTAGDPWRQNKKGYWTTEPEWAGLRVSADAAE